MSRTQLYVVHQNFPGQFRYLVPALRRVDGVTVVGIGEEHTAGLPDTEMIRYPIPHGPNAATHHAARGFELATRHAESVARAIRAHRRPGSRCVVLGHSGFGSNAFVKELIPDASVITYLEYYYHTRGELSDLEALRGNSSSEAQRVRIRARNATMLLDASVSDHLVAPTRYQRSLFPEFVQPSIRHFPDALDTDLWRRCPKCIECRRLLSEAGVPSGHRLLTYVSRGFEEMRGFEQFLAACALVLAKASDVHVVAVGADRSYYSHGRKGGGRAWRLEALRKAGVPSDRITFTGRMDAQRLARLLSRSDCHVYLTRPFVLSWSLLNAMLCGAPVVASDTPPVAEFVDPGVTGHLVDMDDPEAVAEAVCDVLADERAARDIGARAAERVVAECVPDECAARLLELLEA